MSNEKIRILAIESSCDETAAAVIGEKNGKPLILSNIISSQIDLHAKTGGVVPEVASRAHMEAVTPVIAQALLQSQGQKSKVKSQNEGIDYQEAIGLLDGITHIAVTAGPGLIGSLLVGFNAAKTLAYAKELPVIPVNHIEGHIYSAFGAEKSKVLGSFQFPVLALTVSGGHTSLTLLRDHGCYEILGETLDDAVGEAYDKVSKMLGLGYPGGPIISEFASNFRKSGKPSDIVFPRPIINDSSLNFSFSGLKTAVLMYTRKVLVDRKIADIKEADQTAKEEIACAFEEAVADVLVAKTIRAAKKHSPASVVFAGGVSANAYLKQRLHQAVKELNKDIVFLSPNRDLCGDNAAMIGVAAYYHVESNNVKGWDGIQVDSNLELK